MNILWPFDVIAEKWVEFRKPYKQKALLRDNWDKVLNEALDKYGVKNKCGYTVDVGPFNVWASNYPYAFGNEYEGAREDIYPRYKTKRRLKKMILEALNRENETKNRKIMDAYEAKMRNGES